MYKAMRILLLVVPMGLILLLGAYSVYLTQPDTLQGNLNQEQEGGKPSLIDGKTSLTAPKPSIKGGTYRYEKLVTLSAEKGEIYYTTDNSEPTENSTKYEEAIKIKGDMTIKAIAIDGDHKSAVITESYSVPKNTKEDMRVYAHGINYVKSGTKGYLIWSDAYKSGTTASGDWTHDVSYQKLSLKSPKIITAKALMKAPEAQEPASASVAGNGSIIVTFEDGYDSKGYSLSQRYAVYDKNMKVIKKYPSTIALGGHSGHSASTSKYHTVFWSDDWVKGGGVDDMGTGKSVHITTLNLKGKKLCSKKVTQSSSSREWWPIAAASKKYVLMVWQKYVPGKEYSQLMYGVYNPATNKFVKKPKVLDRNLDLLYYSYSVDYLAASNEFIVIASRYDEKANAYLISEKGTVKHTKRGLEGLVREARPAILKKKTTSEVTYPEMKNRVVTLSVKNHKITRKKIYKKEYVWPEYGISGFYSSTGKIHFAVLTKDKLVMKKY